MKGKSGVKDNYPGVIAAGIKNKENQVSVFDCLQGKETQQLRKSAFAKVGESTLNIKQYNDENSSQNIVFGKKTDDSDTFKDFISESRRIHLNPVTALKEQIYESNKREPIGRSYNRGHKLPQETKEPNFRFGKPPAESKIKSKHNNKAYPGK